MPLFVIERTFADQLELSSDDVKLIEEINADEGVRWLFSFLSADRRRTYCLYEAPSAAAIMSAARRGKIPIVLMLRPFGAALVNLAIIEAFPLARVSDEIVGSGDFLELLFRGFVARIEIGMQLLGKFAVCLLYFVGGSYWLYAEHFVRISHKLLLVDQVRTPSFHGDRRHRRSEAEFPGFVAGSGWRSCKILSPSMKSRKCGHAAMLKQTMSEVCMVGGRSASLPRPKSARRRRTRRHFLAALLVYQVQQVRRGSRIA